MIPWTSGACTLHLVLSLRTYHVAVVTLFAKKFHPILVAWCGVWTRPEKPTFVEFIAKPNLKQVNLILSQTCTDLTKNGSAQIFLEVACICKILYQINQQQLEDDPAQILINLNTTQPEINLNQMTHLLGLGLWILSTSLDSWVLHWSYYSYF